MIRAVQGYKNNALNGNSAINNNNKNYSPKTHTFNSNEVNLILKILELSKYYIKNLENKDIMKVNNAITILNARKNNQKIYLLKK
ncbi:MAG TPA: hypothetical protein VJ697_14710 [Nitrososphaeraceae archaeon]|nr:hypothetical protein [Nitrososphaeraceae archaeon]